MGNPTMASILTDAPHATTISNKGKHKTYSILILVNGNESVSFDKEAEDSSSMEIRFYVDSGQTRGQFPIKNYFQYPVGNGKNNLNMIHFYLDDQDRSIDIDADKTQLIILSTDHHDHGRKKHDDGSIHLPHKDK